MCSSDLGATANAGQLIDGKGGVSRDMAITVEGNRIARIQPAAGVRATYDFERITVMPGMIDTHVHLDRWFGKDGKPTHGQGSAAEKALHTAENAHLMLMAGFTTVQSIGAASDVDVRNVIARGLLPGPRILTSYASLNEHSGTPDEIRALVRKQVAAGADVIKLFASGSIRIGGPQTMTDEQIRAACSEAAALGKRSWVHAHSPSSTIAAAKAGCNAIAHGAYLTDTEMEVLAERGMFFEPNIGLVSQNYIEFKKEYLGTRPDFSEIGFAFTEKGIPIKREMFKRALKFPKLKIIMGTDAVAGAFGQNARETIYRVKEAGMDPMAAILSTTSVAADSLGLAQSVGAIAQGMEADKIGRAHV